MSSFNTTNNLHHFVCFVYHFQVKSIPSTSNMVVADCLGTEVTGWDVVNKYDRSERDIEEISVILHILLFGHECLLVFQTT